MPNLNTKFRMQPVPILYQSISIKSIFTTRRYV